MYFQLEYNFQTAYIFSISIYFSKRIHILTQHKNVPTRSFDFS